MYETTLGTQRHSISNRSQSGKENPIEEKADRQDLEHRLCINVERMPKRYSEHYLCAASHIARIHKAPDQFA